jgi:hypothetical protein
MGLGSVASEGFDRLESQPNIAPLAMQTITVAEKGKGKGHVAQAI